MQGNLKGPFEVSSHKFDVRPVRMGHVFFSSHIWLQSCRIGGELDLTKVHVLSRE